MTHILRDSKGEKRETHKREAEAKMEAEVEQWTYEPRMPRTSRSDQKLGARHEEIVFLRTHRRNQ